MNILSNFGVNIIISRDVTKLVAHDSVGSPVINTLSTNDFINGIQNITFPDEILPKSCVYLKNVHLGFVGVFEEPPRIHTFQFSVGMIDRDVPGVRFKNDVLFANLSFPYLVIILGFVYRPNEESWMVTNKYVFFRKSPILYLSDDLFKAPIPNIGGNQNFCIGDMGGGYYRTINEAYGDFIRRFFENRFSRDWYTNCTLYENDDYYNLEKWVRLSQKDPSFVLRAPLKKFTRLSSFIKKITRSDDLFQSALNIFNEKPSLIHKDKKKYLVKNFTSSVDINGVLMFVGSKYEDKGKTYTIKSFLGFGKHVKSKGIYILVNDGSEKDKIKLLNQSVKQKLFDYYMNKHKAGKIKDKFGKDINIGDFVYIEGTDNLLLRFQGAYDFGAIKEIVLNNKKYLDIENSIVICNLNIMDELKKALNETEIDLDIDEFVKKDFFDNVFRNSYPTIKFTSDVRLKDGKSLRFGLISGDGRRFYVSTEDMKIDEYKKISSLHPIYTFSPDSLFIPPLENGFITASNIYMNSEKNIACLDNNTDINSFKFNSPYVKIVRLHGTTELKSGDPIAFIPANEMKNANYFDAAIYNNIFRYVRVRYGDAIILAHSVKLSGEYEKDVFETEMFNLTGDETFSSIRKTYATSEYNGKMFILKSDVFPGLSKGDMFLVKAVFCDTFSGQDVICTESSHTFWKEDFEKYFEEINSKKYERCNKNNILKDGEIISLYLNNSNVGKFMFNKTKKAFLGGFNYPQECLFADSLNIYDIKFCNFRIPECPIKYLELTECLPSYTGEFITNISKTFKQKFLVDKRRNLNV